MAEATVTLKLSPKEFDLIRDALEEMHSSRMTASSPSIQPDPATRSRLKAEALLVSDLGKKLDA
jgi:flagellar biosynthesis/type III secretory pathway protein FliH